jgi:hypothetical protein
VRVIKVPATTDARPTMAARRIVSVVGMCLSSVRARVLGMYEGVPG